MPQFNTNIIDLFQFIQSLQPAFFYKWILLLLLFGYIIFHLVVLNQIRSMDKIITQPFSSAAISFLSILFIAVGILLFIFVFTIHI